MNLYDSKMPGCIGNLLHENKHSPIQQGKCHAIITMKILVQPRESMDPLSAIKETSRGLNGRLAHLKKRGLF